MMKIIISSKIYLYLDYNITYFRVFGLLALAGYIVFLVVAVGLENPRNLQSLSGIIIYILLFYIFSMHPTKVQYKSLNKSP